MLQQVAFGEKGQFSFSSLQTFLGNWLKSSDRSHLN